SQSFPELPSALLAFPDPVILDGEILAWSPDTSQALPFSELQKRLGRKNVSEEWVRSVPVIYMAFDILYAQAELTIEQPLEERRKILEKAFASVPPNGFSVEYAPAAQNPQGQLVFEPTITTERGTPRVILAPALTANSAEHLEEIFVAARQR